MPRNTLNRTSILEKTLLMILAQLEALNEKKKPEIQQESPNNVLEQRYQKCLDIVSADRNHNSRPRELGGSTFHSVALDRFVRQYCCGQPILRVNVFYLGGNGEMYVAKYGERICTICFAHKTEGYVGD